jgi:heat-inducible transcriptional repressor
MPDPGLEPSESLRAKQGYERCEGEVEDILQYSCRILSEMTKYTSLATPPQTDTISVKHVALSVIGEGKVLVVTILNTGHIDHRILDHAAKITTTDLIALNNLLDARLQGAELSNLAACESEEIPTELHGLNALYKKVITAVRQCLTSVESDEVYMDGTTHILRQPEFLYNERMNSILEALEHRRVLYQTLSRAILGRHVTVIIGSENQFAEMHECSFVASSYAVDGRVCGSIGVVGPTRMDYRRAVAAVELMASNLSALLTQLSIW